MLLRKFDFLDLQMFAEGEGATPPATVPAPAPVQLPDEPEAPPVDLLSPDILINRINRERATAQAAQPPAPVAVPETLGQPAPAAPAAPVQPMIAMPPDLLQTLGQLALRAAPPPTQAGPAIPDPVLPPLPEPPDLLMGTKEEREQKYMEDPVGFNDAFYDHKIATARVQAERERITSEHTQRVAQHQLQQDFTSAFTEQVVALGQDAFNQRADVAQEFIKAHPELLSPKAGLPAKAVVAMAFDYAAAKSAPAQVTFDVTRLTPEQKTQAKAAFKDEVIKDYLSGVANGTQLPIVMNGSLPAGKTPTPPANRPTNLDEAETSFLRRRGAPTR